MIFFSAHQWIFGSFHFLFLFFCLLFLFKRESRTIKKILSDFESREKKRKQQEIMFMSRDMIRKNSRIKSLYLDLIEIPKNGTPNQRIKRSHVLRELLRITGSKDLTSGIVNLAERESKRIVRN